MSQVEKLIKIAEEEVGYLEKASNENLDSKTANAGKSNYTKYGKWIGCNGQPWCHSFVSWCANQAGIPSSIIPKTAGTHYGANWFKKNAKFIAPSKSNPPRRGDLMYHDSGKGQGHVGIVVAYNGGDSVETIEGNTNNSGSREGTIVTHKTRKFSYIWGFGRPKYTDESSSDSEQENDTDTKKDDSKKDDSKKKDTKKEDAAGKNPNKASSHTSNDSILQKGDKGSEVVDLQKSLVLLKYDPKGVDGDFGTDTEKAVIAFQKANGLVPDGEVGPKTKKMLQKRLKEYKEAKAKEKAKAKAKKTTIVVEGATLKCSLGTTTTKLMVPKSHGAKIQGKKEATVADSKPNINIMPFGTCNKSNPTLPCTPNIQFQWKNSKSDYKIGGHQALTKGSCLACCFGGIITITDDGQSKSTTKKTTDKVSTTKSTTSSRVLRYGSKGADVEKLQTDLTTLHYDTKGIDGEYGPNTKKAVIAFQKAHGLKPDGIAGPKTKAKIAELLAKEKNQSQKGKVTDKKKDSTKNNSSKEKDTKKQGDSKQETENSSYPSSFEAALAKQMKVDPQTQSNGSWVDATKDQVRKYMDPNNYCTGEYKYQFLDLSAMAGISESDMAKYLSKKGILAGKEKTYLAAAKKYSVSEVYLAAHSSLETGNGTSELAKGVVVKGVKVYNMYGIHAFDKSPVKSGSEYAYEMNWTTPEKAIYGGAKWISEKYINNNQYRQNTLYKMRWNPASPGAHQYATDIKWAVNQTSSIKKMYDSFPNAVLKFDIPHYK
ncbi:MAG TPA: peptidoglycan-binding protein [Lachnospiraceae bacterium]|nr:peptidoglycan-binding protein [Lachnospiraceae bacterium]